METNCLSNTWDDDFAHSLIVYEDRATRSLRLHAAVWDGELRRCPVWTAFGMIVLVDENIYGDQGKLTH